MTKKKSDHKKFHTGSFSAREITYIVENSNLFDAKTIAQHLNRDPKTIQRFIDRKGLDKNRASFEKQNELQRKPIWAELSKQFNSSELSLFLYHWGLTLAQFKEDVYHTEEIQIIDMIKCEVLMNRYLRQQQEANDKVVELEGKISVEKKNPTPDETLIDNWERQIAFYRSSQESIEKAYSSLGKRKDDIFKALKATRDQRVKRLESSKQSFLQWMAQLIDMPEIREEYAKEIEKFRIATNVEYQKLSDYHRYMDGNYDLPILNAKTIKDKRHQELDYQI